MILQLDGLRREFEVTREGVHLAAGELRTVSKLKVLLDL